MMPTRRRPWRLARLAVTLAGIAPLAAPSSARADDGPAIEEARAAYRRGAALAKDGRWREAIVEFEQSLSLRSHATTAYNLGYSQLMLGRFAHAHRMLGRALADNRARTGELTAELVTSVERHLADAERSVARVPVVVQPEDVLLAVDGAPLDAAEAGPPLVAYAGTRSRGPAERAPAAAFELLLDPGSHTVVVSRAGSPDRTLPLYLPAGRTAAVVWTPTGWEPQAVVPAPPEGAAAGLGTQRIGAIALGATGLAVLGAGAVFAGVATSTWSRAEDACPVPDHCLDTRGPDLARSARTEANLATVAFVVGSVATTAGLTLWLTAPSPAAPEHDAPDRAPVAVGLALDGAPRLLLRGLLF